MKKIKFLGAAILAASLIFAGCANGSDDDVDSTPDTEKVVDEKGGEGSEENGGSESGSGEEAGGEENSGEDQNSGSGESSGSGDSGSSSGGESSGSGDSEDAGDGDSGDEDEDTTTNPETDGYPVTFSESSNSYSFANGVYTITLGKAHGADDEWGNQIFIKGLNEAAGIANGDKIKTTATVEADKAITTFFFKNQFHTGEPFPGITKSVSLEANTETTVDIYGNVFDYDDTSTLVIAIRGNEDDTTLTLKDVKVEKLTDYAITSLVVSAASDSVAAGETTTLTAKDQYGFVIADAEFEITSENPASSISGNVLTTGDTAEEITVVAKKGEITSNPLTITITAEKDYAKYWNLETTATGEAAAPNDYFSIWADKNWCGSTVILSDMQATEDGVTLTQSVTGANWFGTQIWYGVSAPSDFTFKVTSTVAGKITINDVVYTLEADTPAEISLTNINVRLKIQLGQHAEGETFLGDCSFTISDFSVTPASAAE